MDWVPFSPADLALCLLMGFAGGASNILFVFAFKLSDVSSVAVLDYTIYIWAALFGLVFFLETP
ncbi:MAG: EamA/RhaT family transporter, partial [Hyphomicrobiales bacterium]